MMDYTHTDFKAECFDLIYAQASISVPYRKEILKEIKRILNVSGIFCAGEIVALREPVPTFVKDIWERSGLDPVPSSQLRKYYESKGFQIISEKDISHTLRDFYENTTHIISENNKSKKPESKKLYSRIKHESNSYLKLGGDKYIGFKSLIMRKAI